MNARVLAHTHTHTQGQRERGGRVVDVKFSCLTYALVISGTGRQSASHCGNKTHKHREGIHTHTHTHTHTCMRVSVCVGGWVYIII